MNQEDSSIFIAGLTAAGKTTHARILADRFSMKYVCGSDFLLAAFDLEGDEVSADFWATTEAKSIGTQRAQTRAIDRRIDDELVSYVSSNSMLVVDSWGGAWLSKKSGLRIWLESSLTSRIWKAMISHGLPLGRTYDEYERLLAEKDEFTKVYFQEEYGFDIFQDRSVFDLVIDISKFLTGPTHKASRASISAVDEILVAFVHWQIDPNPHYLEQIATHYGHYGDRVFLKLPSKIQAHL